MMRTAFQDRQLKEIHAEERKMLADLKATGAVAKIGFYHYEGQHTNLSVMLSQEPMGFTSRCVKGNDPVAAIAQYAKQLFGSGRLKLIEKDSGTDGGYAYRTAAYLVYVA